MSDKAIEEIALIELTRNARVLYRQLKLIRGMAFSAEERQILREIIGGLEKACCLFKA